MLFASLTMATMRAALVVVASGSDECQHPRGPRTGMRFGGMASLLASSFVLVACGASSTSAPDDAGVVDSSTGDAPSTDGSTKDASAPDVTTSKDGAPLTDSGTTATGSKPPLGSTLCGSGTFTPADSMTVCQTASPYFPPQYNVTKDCGGAGFSFSSGLWEAWCTPSGVYIFARFDDATGFGIGGPTGNFEAGNGGGSANAYLDAAKEQIFVDAPNVQPSAKSGDLFLLNFDGTTDAGTNFRMVGGAALTWK